MAAFGKVRVSGPSRENARAGWALSNSADRGGDARLGIARREPRGFGVHALGGALPSEPLQRDAVEEPVGDRSRPRSTFERRNLRGGVSRVTAAGALATGTNTGRLRAKFG